MSQIKWFLWSFHTLASILAHAALLESSDVLGLSLDFQLLPKIFDGVEIWRLFEFLCVCLNKQLAYRNCILSLLRLFCVIKIGLIIWNLCEDKYASEHRNQEGGKSFFTAPVWVWKFIVHIGYFLWIFQPFCDGTHKTKAQGLSPLRFVPEKDTTVWLCGCKYTNNRPYCDGTHKLDFIISAPLHEPN